MKDKFVACRNCHGKSFKPGFYYEEIEGVKYLKECSCHIRFVAKQKVIKYLERDLIPYDFIKDFDPDKNYRGDKSKDSVLRNIDKIINSFNMFNDKMMYFVGKPGTQKTSFAYWIMYQLLQKNKTVKYITMQSLIAAIQAVDAGFANDIDEKQQAIYRECMSADLLIVDDAFSKDRCQLYKSGYQLPFFISFIRERIERRQKAILFISDEMPEKIQDNFGEALQALIVKHVNQYKTLLAFKDVYMEEVTRFDVTTLFN